jgi:hypothetical protein
MFGEEAAEVVSGLGVEVLVGPALCRGVGEGFRPLKPLEDSEL